MENLNQSARSLASYLNRSLSENKTGSLGTSSGRPILCSTKYSNANGNGAPELIIDMQKVNDNFMSMSKQHHVIVLACRRGGIK
jgi:hypothetical protein